MQKFDLTIFRETRIYIGLGLIPIGLLASIVLGSKLGGFVFVIILMALYFLLAGYFAIGHLTVIIANDELQFKWTDKYLFNFKDIESVKLNDIRVIVIDKEQFIRKIKTNDRIISINNTQMKSNDAGKFIYQLCVATKGYNMKRIDSWDEWAEKGYFKTAYWINTSILAVAGVIIVIAIARGFYSRHFFWVLCLLPQQFYFGQIMKRKLIK